MPDCHAAILPDEKGEQTRKGLEKRKWGVKIFFLSGAYAKL
jgi:hypothetical protein